MSDFYSEVWFWLIVIGVILIIIGIILYATDREVRWYHWTLWIVGGFFLLVGVIWAIGFANENETPKGYTKIEGTEGYLDPNGNFIAVDGRALDNGDVALPAIQSSGNMVVASPVAVQRGPLPGRRTCRKSCGSTSSAASCPKSVTIAQPQPVIATAVPIVPATISQVTPVTPVSFVQPNVARTVIAQPVPVASPTVVAQPTAFVQPNSVVTVPAPVAVAPMTNTVVSRGPIPGSLVAAPAPVTPAVSSSPVLRPGTTVTTFPPGSTIGSALSQSRGVSALGVPGPLGQ